MDEKLKKVKEHVDGAVDVLFDVADDINTATGDLVGGLVGVFKDSARKVYTDLETIKEAVFQDPYAAASEEETAFDNELSRQRVINGGYTVISTALADVVAERFNQIHIEGHDAADDDGYPKGRLALAGAVYASMPFIKSELHKNDWFNFLWPFKNYTSYHTTTVRDDLVKAAALILAEIERHDRMVEIYGNNDR